MDFKQNPDGTAGVYSDQEGKVLWQVGGPASIAGVSSGQAQNQYRAPHTVRIVLNTSGSGTASALATWQNTTPNDLLIGHTQIRITTAQTPTCTLTVGVGSSALSLDSDKILIDSFAAAGTVGLFDNITDKGTLGKARVALPANSWVNVICNAAGSATSLVGVLYFDVIVA